jgi:hypothetical protein
MSTNNEPIKLRIPRQDLTEFTLFGLTSEQAKRWADNLPRNNAGQLAQQLRGAISDLNRLDMEPELRFEIMEAMRPSSSNALTSLQKFYLNQPVALPEEPRKASRLAQSLLEHVTTSYTITAIQAIQRRQSMSGTNPAKLVCQAVHRAITTSSMKLLVSYQLYQPVELNAWTKLHQLFLLAERQRLAIQIVGDEIGGDGSVRDTYLRAMMMGCCKANQLRQRDLAGIFKGLGSWVQHLQLLPADGSGDGLFLVDFSSDHPPIYGSLYSEDPGSGCRFINTDKLVSYLQNLREETGERAVVFDKDSAVAPNVLDHVMAAWGVMSKRNFARAPAQEKLWISVGLSNTHYYVSGGSSFEELVAEDTLGGESEDSANPFMNAGETQEQDVWEQAFRPGDEEEDRIDMEEIEFHIREGAGIDSSETRDRHPVFPVRMANVSPGGYCLEWSASIPSHIKTGDVVSIREVDSNSWSIAVIRWVNQMKDQTTLLGVELLSPRATPYGARVQHKTGDDGDLMRALLLPEIKLVGQPNTLITPRVGFKERQKIILVRGGEESYIQLFKKVSSTASYNQFEFRRIQQLEEVAMRDKADVVADEFESLWNDL